MIRDNLLEFLRSQKVLTIDTVDDEGNPWNTNVYYSINDKGEFFFVTPMDTEHAEHINTHPQVSFSVVWHDSEDLSDRKGVQGRGNCELLTNPKKIAGYLHNHHQYFPSWKDTINLKAITQKLIESRPYIIRPSYIKFWNDELFGDKLISDPVEEYNYEN